MNGIYAIQPTYIVQGGIAKDLFHATTTDSATKIMADKFEISRGTFSFLGPGVYFCESDIEWNFWYARNKCGYKNFSVIRTTVDLGVVLFANNSVSKIIMKIKEEYSRRLKQPVTDGRAYEILVSEILPSKNIKVDTLKRIVKRRNKQLYPYMDVCVRDPKKIQEKEIVYTE